MPVNRPQRRRIVHASEVVEDAITKEDLAKPESITPRKTLELGYEKRLERQIELASLALNKYEKILRRGVDLTDEQERRMIAQQDSLRKLELSLQSLLAKHSEDEETDVELAMEMVDKGMPIDDVCRIFTHNQNLRKEIERVLRERQEQ